MDDLPEGTGGILSEYSERVSSLSGERFGKHGSRKGI